ncbi:hypothetical protein ACJMK2_013376 [Sinanodonta woodiana]|uniref:Uncharacterized protein n=1 Tax=Sinanodonta woodiana TaxID=1069815 RepID=A0ABD3UY04_SINWO
MTTRLITVKSLTNTRCRAYQYRKCLAEVAIVGEKSKVVSHIYKKHTALDQAQFYCKQIWRERSRQGEMCSQLSTIQENVQEDHELGYIITLAHPAAPMMLTEAERNKLNFLVELLDYGSPINFYVGHLPPTDISRHTPISLSTMVSNSTSVQQKEAHHSQPPRNTEPKDAYTLAEQPDVIAVEGHQRKSTSKTSVSCSHCCCDTKEELRKLVARIDTLKDIMDKQVEMLMNNSTHSTALMVNFIDAIHYQTSTYRSLNNDKTKMIEHMNDTKKPHPREDGCKNQIGEGDHSQDKYRGGHQDRRDSEQDKNETVRDNQRESRRERSPMHYKHRHSPY